MSKMETVYSRPIVNPNLIASMTLEDLRLCFSKVKESRCGEYLFVGRKPKKDPLQEVFAYEKDFTGLPFDYQIQSRDCYDPSFLSDTINFVLESGKSETVTDYLLERALLEAFSVKLKKDLYDKYRVRAEVRKQAISNYRCIVSLILQRGKSRMVLPYLDSCFDDVFLRQSLAFYPDGMESINMENIELAGNFRLAVKRMLLVTDFCLKGDVSFHGPISFSEDDFRKKASTMKKASVFKCIYDKGELVHDQD